MNTFLSESIKAARFSYISCDIYLLLKKNSMLVLPKNHKKPKKRMTDRIAVAYKSIRKYIGVRVVSAFYPNVSEFSKEAMLRLTSTPMILKSSLVTLIIRIMFDNSQE